jgi:hypothetical protein
VYNIEALDAMSPAVYNTNRNGILLSFYVSNKYSYPCSAMTDRMAQNDYGCTV